MENELLSKNLKRGISFLYKWKDKRLCLLLVTYFFHEWYKQFSIQIRGWRWWDHTIPEY